jgi:hypothetical protein
MSSTRKLLVWIGLAAALAVLAFQIAQLDRDSPLLASPDFAMYWTSGRLHLQGENPYDPEKLLPLEQEHVPGQANVFVMYSPPWILTVVLPFALLSYHAGRLLWLLLHASVVLLCADVLWRLYGGPTRYRWLAWLIAFGFVPTLYLLKSGQIGALLLLGAVGFLYFERRGRDLAAGGAVALLALKPHLVYLFWPALLLWVIQHRRWRILLGAALVGLCATLVPLSVNPAVVQQYRESMTAYRPTVWLTPTFGTVLRLVVGEDREWLQFVPLLPGTVWFVVYWLLHRKTWDWARQTPLLLLVSFLSTCYGAWSHDYVLLLVPVMQVACSIARDFRPVWGFVAVAVFLAVDALVVLLDVVGYSDELFLLWMSPALLLAYLVLGHGERGASAPSCALPTGGGCLSLAGADAANAIGSIEAANQ